MHFDNYDCDICGSKNCQEIFVTKDYLGGHPLHVCCDCGFIYVRKRRNEEKIAEEWSETIFDNSYNAKIPAIIARHVYVAECMDKNLFLNQKTLCDIGAGTGQFLDIIRRSEYAAVPFGIEPSKKNCATMTKLGIRNYCGTVSSYINKKSFASTRFQLVSVLWTLENTQSCRSIIDTAYNLLIEGGYIIIATGSRILVPFKKPLYDYLGLYGGCSTPDLHSFRFSTNSLRNLLTICNFDIIWINRYLDSDYLVMIGKKKNKSTKITLHKDNPEEIIDFFNRWDFDTRQFFQEGREKQR